MFEVNVSCRRIDAFVDLVGVQRVESVRQMAGHIRELVGTRAIWNINSTATGGGVAEMLRSLLRYARGLGVLARWLVMEGSPEFFRVTKRLHNALHDSPGDGSPLGPAETRIYEEVIRDNILALDALIQPGDIVVCHDPQTAGLIPHLVARNIPVVWRCHIGHDWHGVDVDKGWAFLRKYIEHVPLAIFSRASYAPDWLPRKRSIVLPPNIDPFSAKNQMLDEQTVRAILVHIGLVDGSGSHDDPVFVRDDGSLDRVDRKADLMCVGGAPSYETPLVVQVSRWDRMKDPLGVLRGFAELVKSGQACGAHLLLAGPNVRGIADDPEGPQVLDDVEHAWRALPDALRAMVHLAQLPMNDTDENAVMVNALQRHAAVVVQKSLREGFGLTVSEALWKRRAVVASAVGGIQDQIRDGIDGLLVCDPANPGELAALLARVLADPALARSLGNAGYERVREHFLSISALERWAELVATLLASMSETEMPVEERASA
ncbi:MAG: Trehalose synthase [Labilithrix sp.]|nr:Trehalose synthase [Labilithrix sp.]